MQFRTLGSPGPAQWFIATTFASYLMHAPVVTPASKPLRRHLRQRPRLLPKRGPYIHLVRLEGAGRLGRASRLGRRGVGGEEGSLHLGVSAASDRAGVRVGGARSEKGGQLCQQYTLSPSLPGSRKMERDRASRATAFSAIVQLRRPRYFDSPPTQHHAYLSRSSRQSSRMRRDEPVSIR
jgi:hypothetical protein